MAPNLFLILVYSIIILANFSGRPGDIAKLVRRYSLGHICGLQGQESLAQALAWVRLFSATALKGRRKTVSRVAAEAAAPSGQG